MPTRPARTGRGTRRSVLPWARRRASSPVARPQPRTRGRRRARATSRAAPRRRRGRGCAGAAARAAARSPSLLPFELWLAFLGERGQALPGVVGREGEIERAPLVLEPELQRR